MPTATKRTLCLALTQCNFEYSVSSWYPAMSQITKRILQVVQNTQKIKYAQPGTKGPPKNITKHTGFLLNVDDRTKQIRLHNAHKVFYKQAPEYLMANFNKSRNRPGMNTRHKAYNGRLLKLSHQMSPPTHQSSALRACFKVPFIVKSRSFSGAWLEYA